jgi:predicted nucleic acid-binding protein
LIVEHDQEIQSKVSEIMADAVLQKLVDINRDRSAADPFVVATAKTRGLILVTQEDYGKKTAVKIPNVCDSIGVKHIKLVDLIVAENRIM